MGFVQVLVANLPVGLASVDCDGTETSLLQCSSSQKDIPGCRILNQNFTDSTVLACANSSPGMTLALKAWPVVVHQAICLFI